MGQLLLEFAQSFLTTISHRTIVHRQSPAGRPGNPSSVSRGSGVKFHAVFALPPFNLARQVPPMPPVTIAVLPCYASVRRFFSAIVEFRAVSTGQFARQ